jgi:hypothetical protein
VLNCEVQHVGSARLLSHHCRQRWITSSVRFSFDKYSELVISIQSVVYLYITSRLMDDTPTGELLHKDHGRTNQDAR